MIRAAESKEETRGGTVKEYRDLWVLDQTSDKYTETQTATSLANLLENLGPNGQKLLTAEEIDTINETGQVTIGSRTIVFKEILTIGSEYDKGHIKIGDKLSYSANGAEDWIVFGKDDDGNVLLTTAQAVGSFTPIYTKEHWFTWENELDAQCTSYGATLQGKTITARSIRIDDINKIVGFTEPEFKTYKFTTDDDGNGQFSNGKINYYYPDDKTSSFVKATVNTLVIEEGSSEIPAKELESNAYYYKQYDDEYKISYNKDGTWLTEKIDLTKNLKNVDNMKYVVGESGSYMQYYVASRAVNVTSSIVNLFGSMVSNGTILRHNCSMCSSYSYEVRDIGGGPTGFGVRPIVELPSNIEIQEVSSGIYDIK